VWGENLSSVKCIQYQSAEICLGVLPAVTGRWSGGPGVALSQLTQMAKVVCCLYKILCQCQATVQSMVEGHV
jgi:hypothetical protein